MEESQMSSKFYRQKWLQSKLDFQQSKRKRPVKKVENPDEATGDKPPPKKMKKKNVPEASKDELEALEDNLGDLKNDLVFQNLEMK